MKILPLFLIAALNWSNCTMAYDYSPNSANDPATIRLPNDGDAEDAASVTDPFEDLADKDARKIDGVGGGTYAPTGAIIIGGSGLDVQGPFDALGADIGTSGMNCSGTANFFAPVHCFDAAIFDSTLDCAGAATFTGPVVLSGAQTHKVDGASALVVESGSNLTVAAGATAAMNGTTTYGGRIRSTGIGRMETRTGFGVTFDDDLDITMAMGVQHIQAVLSATHRYVMKNTGCVGDETISILNESSATHPLNIFQHDGTTQIAALDSVGSDYIGVELWNDGLGNAASSWHVKSATHKP